MHAHLTDLLGELAGGGAATAAIGVLLRHGIAALVARRRAKLRRKSDDEAVSRRLAVLTNAVLEINHRALQSHKEILDGFERLAGEIAFIRSSLPRKRGSSG